MLAPVVLPEASAGLEIFRDNGSLEGVASYVFGEAIAFDKVDAIDSAWDSCETGCEVPLQHNRLCEAAAGGLAGFDWAQDVSTCGAGTKFVACTTTTVRGCPGCPAGFYQNQASHAATT